MITPSALAGAFDRNVKIAQMESNGLTHEESLLQPEPRGNCMNWVLGHMLTGRNDILRALESPFVVDEALLERYKRESEPITSEGDGILPLERILELLVEGQKQISERMPQLTETNFERPVTFSITGKPRPLNSLCFFLYFHDSYHIGQTSYLRQLAGKDDQII